MNEEANHSDKYIGSKVLSMKFGIGVISSIKRLQENGDNYYVVEYGKKNVKNYFPVDNNKSLRFVSSRKEFEGAFEVFEGKRESKKFSSIKERHVYFNRPFEKDNIKSIANRLLDLICTLDLTPKEQRICDKLVETVEIEASIIFKMTLSESKEFVSRILNNKK